MTLAVAHRGNPTVRRENTMASLESAVAAGADMVEIDLRRAADGTIVLLHDETLGRLWGVDRAVADMDWPELTAASGGGIPLLQAVLTAVDCPLMVDFTGPEVVDGAVDIVSRAGAVDRCLFVSGHVGALRRVRDDSRPARIGLTWTSPGTPPRQLLDELAAECWNPAWPLVTAASVSEMHQAGVSVSTWTVDSEEDMLRIIDMGVDAIVSNLIGTLRTVVGNAPAR